MFSWFQDYHKGRERLLAVLTVIFLVVLFIALGVIFYRQHEGYIQKTFVLTRDKVPEEPKPSPTPSPFELAKIALMENQIQKAREILLHAEVPETEKPQKYLLLGLLELEHGKPEVAASFFEQSELLKPSAEAFFGRARAYLEMGNYKEAQTALEFAHKMNSSDITISNALYLVQIQNGMGEELRQRLVTKAALGITHTASSWILAAVALDLEVGNYSSAADLLLKAINLFPYENFKFLIGLEPIRKFADHPYILPFFLPPFQMTEPPPAESTPASQVPNSD